MSSRALRKAHRELEQQEHLQHLEAENGMLEDEHRAAPKQSNLFDMLDDDDSEEQPESPNSRESESRLRSDFDGVHGARKQASVDRSSTELASKSKKKKGKSKDSKKKPASKKAPSASADSQLDEIDLALHELSTSEPIRQQGNLDSNGGDPALNEVIGLLRVDTQHLQAANEMRRLFGRVAIETDQDVDDDGGGRRRRGRGGRGGTVGIAGAVAGRHNAGDRGLSSLGLRRNMFIKGKEEWPRATGGGLAMEVEEKRADSTILYRFLHSRSYQDVQMQFEICVASMDPDRMIQLLQFNRMSFSTSSISCATRLR